MNIIQRILLASIDRVLFDGTSDRISFIESLKWKFYYMKKTKSNYKINKEKYLEYKTPFYILGREEIEMLKDPTEENIKDCLTVILRDEYSRLEIKELIDNTLKEMCSHSIFIRPYRTPLSPKEFEKFLTIFRPDLPPQQHS